MIKKNDNDLFFLCSLIEQIGRDTKNKRSAVVTMLGKQALKHIYNYADVFHCDPIVKASDDVIGLYNISNGTFDNVSKSKYRVPSVWDIGAVYSKLIEDVGNDDTIDSLYNVYTSWIDDSISNFNSSFYYEPRGYIAECFRENQVLA